MENNLYGERIAALIKALNLSQNAFAAELGTSGPRISNITKNRNRPDSEILSAIVRRYPAVNPLWLLIGDGSMFLTASSSDTRPALTSENAPLNAPLNAHLIPKDEIKPAIKGVHSTKTEFIVATQDISGNPTYSLINHKAAANYLSGYQSQEYYESLGVVTLPRALVGSPKQGVFFQIEGDSMTPKFQHGDWVACTLLDRSEWHIVRDLDCYVVVSATYGIQFKRVKNRFEKLGFLRCKSDNRRHRAYNIEEENLLQLFRFVLHVSPDASNPEGALYQKVDHLEDTTTDLRQLYEQMQEQIQALTDTQKPIKPKEKAH